MANKCLQTILYRLKPGCLENFIHQRALLVESYQKMAGFICIETWHSPDDPNLYVDLIHFDSQEAAQTAHQQFNELPCKDGFMATIDSIDFNQRFIRHL